MDLTGADPAEPRVRLVATDLDGTIVGRGGVISPRVVAALTAVLDLDLPVVFVSGRPPRWMHEVAEATSHHGIAICANGALVYDLATETVVERFEIQPDVALEAVRRLRAVMPSVVFAVERGDGFRHEAAYVPRWDGPAQDAPATVEELLTTPLAKLVVRDETSRGDAMLALAREAVGDLVTVTHSNPRDCLLEISAPGVTKATTLATVAAELGVDAAGVLAFGDQPNDVAMLRWAGRAYAMAGGHPEALAAVPTHAPAVEHDGVAVVLEQLLAAGVIRR